MTMHICPPKFEVGERVIYAGIKVPSVYIVEKAIIYVNPLQIVKYQLKLEKTGKMSSGYTNESQLRPAPEKMPLKKAMQIMVEVVEDFALPETQKAIERVKEELREEDAF